MLRPVRWHGVAGQAQVIGGLEFVLDPADQAQPEKHQQLALSIAAQAANGVVRQAVQGGVSGKAALLQPRQSAAFRAGPQRALPILVKLQKAVADDAG